MTRLRYHLAAIRLCEHPVQVRVGTLQHPSVHMCATCGSEWQETEWRKIVFSGGAR